MKLYYCETLNPRKACAAARYLDANVEFVRVDLATGEQRTLGFLALNPNGKVPVLQHGEGESLWEANAIMCFLSDAVGSDFWPRDERQADVIRWLSWDASHFTLHGATLWFENEVKPLFGQGPDHGIVAEAERQLRQFAEVLDDHLSRRTFVVADRLSVADFALGAALPYWRTSRLPLDGFEHIARWNDRLTTLPAWREPFPIVA
ncbi:glutathione S-transferase family protein [Ciceribacter sp. L1K23]|uniref:glutathione S-transferase family protein n=1 Tax=Ciceribacter sp. L1K23 TaxID=2820276 RepID=UPI001B82A9FD|nr:glutathione S-transferase family protein [Ciceribacter sp. L1K23]MBR0554665.1 glutathione S-transferase family protein [Ciceribacter sp. L1K23]